ncbi:MAG: tetratricopeptide repeat protein [Myxococcota bacterium]
MWVVSGLIAVLLAPGPAAAQEPRSPTPTQLQLYQEAHQAFEGERFEAAASLLRRALQGGELNLLHLSLGRALFRLDRCEEAAEHYDLALEAPPVIEPPAEDVRARIGAYREDLGNCSGTLVIRCTEAEQNLIIEGQGPVHCGANPLPPGTYTLRGSGSETESRQVEVRAMEETSIDAPTSERTESPPRPVPFPIDTMGLVIAAVGGAVLVGALVLDLTALDSAIDDFDSAREVGSANANDLKSDAELLQGVTLAGYIAGAAILATGLTFWIWGVTSSEEPPATTVGGMISPWGAGLELRSRF